MVCGERLCDVWCLLRLLSGGWRGGIVVFWFTWCSGLDGGFRCVGVLVSRLPAF